MSMMSFPTSRETIPTSRETIHGDPSRPLLAMSVQLFGKREVKRLGSVANDGAGAGYTSFAKNMMAKMGWTEGQGLGKDAQGRSTYVKVRKKDDNAGLGTEKAKQNNVNDQWYFNAFDSALANMGSKRSKGSKRGKKAEKKKSKKEGKSADDAAQETDCMYEKMFKATGGARMGMRARASQNGKLARTESEHSNSAVKVTVKNGASDSDDKRRKKKKRKRPKVEKPDVTEPPIALDQGSDTVAELEACDRGVDTEMNSLLESVKSKKKKRPRKGS